MRYSSFTPKPCKECGSIYHSKGYHKPRKPLKPASSPMRREAVKTRQKRLETADAWHVANPPDKNGYWYCYISKHPSCPKRLTMKTLVLEHNLSKARRKDLQFDITNIFPACSYDNKDKGSLSAEEYLSKPSQYLCEGIQQPDR